MTSKSTLLNSTQKSTSTARWLAFAGPFEFPSSSLTKATSPTIQDEAPQSSTLPSNAWNSIKTYYRPSSFSLPFDDAFLCPEPDSDTRFAPHEFETPEQEEQWWNDINTWPGDHLFASPEDTGVCAVEHDANEIEWQFSSQFSRRSSDPVQIEEEDDSDSNMPMSPGTIQEVPRTQVHPNHGAFGRNIESKPSNSSDSHSEKTPTPFWRVPPRSTCLPNNSISSHSSYTGDESSDSDDSDVPRTPPLHTSPDPPSRLYAKSSTRNCDYLPIKRSLTYKPSLGVCKAPRCADAARRTSVGMSRLTLAAIRAEFNRLRAENLKPTKFLVEHPQKDSSHPGRRWRCAWEDDNIRCSVTSERKAEARRHTLTHETLRWLCGNPECCQLFSREDAVVRHINQSSCKGKLPLGTTTKTETPAIIMDDGQAQLVQLVWVREPRDE
ncbi:hypothetical protein K439DRAFT_1662849 [Ramaria rubella]|nr:hypothetical protein K439DRAFT_1662849 [Ramaria rubella]